MEATPLVSVVTPFYNTAEYLAECIESVLRQSYANWEYTLVNNHSTDGSDRIAQSYVDRFPGKIRLVHTETFLSQVKNYNFALSLISPHSKYTKMVQADDWIFPECLKSMVEVAEAHPKVGIVAGYELEGDHTALNGLPYPRPEVSGREICRLNFIDNIPLFGTPTSILMRSELVRSRAPFYREELWPFEDSHACFEALHDWNYGFVHQVLTYSRRDNESHSISGRIRQFQMILFIRLSELVIQGKYYLTDREYQACLKKAEGEYFYFLGLSALQGMRNPEFWSWHKKQLASIGYSLNFAFISRWMLLVFFDYLGNPKRTLEYLWPRRKRVVAAAIRFMAVLREFFVRGKSKNTDTRLPATESTTIVHNP
jgi:glycosyltransferase involved in cell wall biosynthesis